MVGRGLRNSVGKQDCHVIDMVASLEKGIVTAPTLFGLDPHELLKEVDFDTLKAMRNRKESEREREELVSDPTSIPPANASLFKGNVTFTHYDDVNTLIAHTSGEHHIRTISPLAWVQVDHNRHVLSNSSGSFLTVKLEERKFVVSFTQKIPKQTERSESPFMRPFDIAKTSTFEDAVHAADTYAKKRFVVPIVLTNAAWRRALATPEQVTFLNKFREEGDELELGSVTKGKAADQITKIKHGARGWLKRIKSDHGKAAKEKQKKERDTIRVGPVLG